MRILALDLGKRRIGVAMSDPLGITAQGQQTIERTNIREDMARLKAFIGENGVGLDVVGNPLHMSGNEGRGSGHAREFAERLGSHAKVAVEMWDERLTSVEAGRVLRKSGISIEKRAKAVDRLSAVLILDNYLAAHGDTPAQGEYNNEDSE